MGKEISTEEFDRIFDEGSDIMPYLNLDSATVVDPKKTTKRVVVDFPAWMVQDLDKEAERLAIPRQPVIKMLVDQGLRKAEASAQSRGHKVNQVLKGHLWTGTPFVHKCYELTN